MRRVIDRLLYENEDAVLLVADFGKFPLMETTDRYFNVGLSETLLVNVAIGMALANKHIFIYSAANFVTYRAYEQIKLYLNDGNDNLNITFLNGGAGFCYAECGRGHYPIDDICLLTTNLKNIRIFLPYDQKSTRHCILKSFKGINYIRLCLDNANDFKATRKYKRNIVTIGWLVQYLQDIITRNKLRYNVIPIVQLSELENLNANKVIYDNVNVFDIDKNFKNKNIKCINAVFDKTGYDRNTVLKKFKFDQKSIIEFIKTND